MSEPETAAASDPELVEVGRRVSWPQFMSQTSMLMDRTVEGESLFARIAAQKDALIARAEALSISREIGAVQFINALEAESGVAA